MDRIKDEYYGEAGTPERGRLERELETLRIGFKIRSAREKRNMTQAELASHIDKKRTFISKVENHGQNITLKTLFDIVERGRVAHGDGCSVSPPTNTQCTGNTSFVINQLVIILLVINILVIFVDVLKTG